MASRVETPYQGSADDCLAEAHRKDVIFASSQVFLPYIQLSKLEGFRRQTERQVKQYGIETVECNLHHLVTQVEIR